MSYIKENNAKEHVYPTYGRQFISYRWYKPLLVGFIGAVMYLILTIALVVVTGIVTGVATGNRDVNSIFDSISGGYDTMNMADPFQSAITLGSLVIMIPALWVASVIVRDRPFSSYSSSRGGWSSKVFWRCFGIAFLVMAVPCIVRECFINGTIHDYQMKFTIVSFIVLTVLGPLQCIAEEYIFRGFLMQTFGSWFRIPLLAVVLQAAVFMTGHPYNDIGKVSILISGMVFGLTAWFGRGLEVSSALHVVNNMTIFYMQGLNLASISSNVGVGDLIFDACTGGAYVLIIFIISRKTNWFNKIRKNDAAKFNKKVHAKRARKAAKRGLEYAEGAGSAAAEALADDVLTFDYVGTGESSEAGREAAAADGSRDAAGAESSRDIQAAGRVSRAGESGGKHFKK